MAFRSIKTRFSLYSVPMRSYLCDYPACTVFVKAALGSTSGSGLRLDDELGSRPPRTGREAPAVLTMGGPDLQGHGQEFPDRLAAFQPEQVEITYPVPAHQVLTISGKGT